MKNINQLKKEIEKSGNKVWNKRVDIRKICEKNNIHFEDWLEYYNKELQLQTLQKVCEEIKKIEQPEFEATTHLQCWNDGFNCCIEELLKKFQGEEK